MATKKELTMSEKLYALANDAAKAREKLSSGKYKNGSYSGSAGVSAMFDFAHLQLTLQEMAKQALIAEVRAETQEQLLTRIQVQIGV